MKVRVKDIAHDQIYSESKHPNITIGNVYYILGIEYGDYRILNDNNEPTLYEKEIFDIVDSSIPQDWIKEDCGDGDFCMYPLELSINKYFFEQYFDYNKEVREAFDAYIQKLKSQGIM